MPVARPERQEPRVIAHVDMDCFYVQVEQRKNPDLRGVPTAVVQYNSWKGGGLIAVGYEARKFGVKRSMRGDEAKRVCPDIQLVQVPVARGKADLNLYRSAGSEVVAILSTKGKCERASIDEVYLDLTETAKSMLLEAPPEVLGSIPEEALKSHVLGLGLDANKKEDVRKWLSRPDADYEEKLLACGAIIVAELRIRVLQETEFTCSAGIAHNKMLAKLASPMYKPAQQTVVPTSSVPDLLASLPVKKMKQLGGKLGSALQDDLGINTVGDLLKFSEQKLQDYYGINTGTWLWKIARGISGDEVEDRLLPKSHGCGKTFPGPMTLKTTTTVKHWLNQLCEELSDRIQSDLDQNKRIAQTLTLHARAFKENELEPQKKFPSKSCALRYGASKIQEDAMRLFESGLSEFLNSKNVGWGITSLAVGASKIIDIPNGTTSILKYFNEKCSSSNSSDCSDALLEESNHAVTFISKRDDENPRSIAPTESTFHTKGLSEKNANVKGTTSILKYFNEKCSSSNSSDCSDALLEESNHAVTFISKRDDENPRSIAPTESTFHTKGLSEKNANVKGTILGYFSGCSSSDQRSANKIDIEEHERMAIASELKSNPNPNLNTNNNWGFNIEEIDPSVVDELPLEIQREIRGWIHPSKRINTGKKGSTIAHYFSPARN